MTFPSIEDDCGAGVCACAPAAAPSTIIDINCVAYAHRTRSILSNGSAAVVLRYAEFTGILNHSATNRYSRQIRFAPFGAEGQQQLSRATAVIVGCGALGTVQASLLARAGVGTLRLIDRDYVEESNLQRQLLYTEEDARAGLPKAEAARRHLAEANSACHIEAAISDLDSASAGELLEGA